MLNTHRSPEDVAISVRSAAAKEKQIQDMLSPFDLAGWERHPVPTYRRRYLVYGQVLVSFDERTKKYILEFTGGDKVAFFTFEEANTFVDDVTKAIMQ